MAEGLASCHDNRSGDENGSDDELRKQRQEMGRQWHARQDSRRNSAAKAQTFLANAKKAPARTEPVIGRVP
jgi:hypothetical protein